MAHKGTEILNAVIQELKDRNIAYRVDKSSGKHMKVRFRHKGRNEMVVFSRSPSDQHAVKNAVKVVHRLVQ